MFSMMWIYWFALKLALEALLHHDVKQAANIDLLQTIASFVWGALPWNQALTGLFIHCSWELNNGSFFFLLLFWPKEPWTRPSLMGPALQFFFATSMHDLEKVIRCAVNVHGSVPCLILCVYACVPIPPQIAEVFRHYIWDGCQACMPVFENDPCLTNCNQITCISPSYLCLMYTNSSPCRVSLLSQHKNLQWSIIKTLSS